MTLLARPPQSFVHFDFAIRHARIEFVPPSREWAFLDPDDVAELREVINGAYTMPFARDPWPGERVPASVMTPQTLKAQIDGVIRRAWRGDRIARIAEEDYG